MLILAYELSFIGFTVLKSDCYETIQILFTRHCPAPSCHFLPATELSVGMGYLQPESQSQRQVLQAPE
jgi:hypothetical protein